MSADKYIFKIWSVDRKKRKVVLSEPALKKIIDAGKLKSQLINIFSHFKIFLIYSSFKRSDWDQNRCRRRWV